MTPDWPPRVGDEVMVLTDPPRRGRVIGLDKMPLSRWTDIFDDIPIPVDSIRGSKVVLWWVENEVSKANARFLLSEIAPADPITRLARLL